MSIRHKEYLGLFLCSMLFSVMHFSIYNFVPILIAGLIFGFIALKTKNLKLNILIHSFFNGIQLILNYLYQVKVINYNIEKEVHFQFVFLVICSITLLISLYFLTKHNEHLPHKS